MGKRLQTIEDHVTDIRISTATVDIQVMRIGTKQMTLAVFRQLPTKDIFGPYGDLLAPPWGWVNYDHEQAKPFVFSYEGVLYRSDVLMGVQKHLVVKPEIEDVKVELHQDPETGKWVAQHFKQVPTGRWLLQSRDQPWNFSLVFTTEGSARTHMRYWNESVAILEAAPQLFIGV